MATYTKYQTPVRANPSPSPVFIRQPVLNVVKLTNQIVDRVPSGTTNPIPLYAAGDNGGLVEAIEVYALGVNVKSVLRLYVAGIDSDEYYLLRELVLPVVTTAPADDIITGYPIRLDLFKILFPASSDPAKPNTGARVPPGFELAVALGAAIAAGVNVVLTGGDY
jgi:hypothetical protein